MFRHYWVLVKFLITAVATLILLKYLQGLGLAGAAVEAAPAGAAPGGFRSPTHVAHSCAALIALLVNATLSVYKPRGMTSFGRKRQQRSPAIGAAVAETDGGGAVGTPRWVKVFAIVAAILALLAVVGKLTGGGAHGPGRHMLRGSGDH